jgi:hypothetical protein
MVAPPFPIWFCRKRKLHVHQHSLTLLTSTLKMEAAYTPETSMSLPTSTWCKDPRAESTIRKLRRWNIANPHYSALPQEHKCPKAVSDIWWDHKETPVKCFSLRSFAFLKRLKLYGYISSIKTNLPIFYHPCIQLFVKLRYAYRLW